MEAAELQKSSCFGAFYYLEREMISLYGSSKFTFIVFLLGGATAAFILTLCPRLADYIWNGTKQLSSSHVSSSVTKYTSHYEETSFGLTKNRRKSDPDLNAEALASLKLALEMKEEGKDDKSLRLFQHAIALDPKHADILNEYGEFLEHKQKNILLAEHMYTMAITVSPTHTKALTNRKRTLPLVEEIDQDNFQRIDKKRDMLYKIPDTHPGLRRAKRESYFQHIYHTNAMEGNTMTLSQTRAVVETRMAIGGKSILEHNEILGLDAALSYINNTLIQRIGAIKVQDILDIHQRVLGYVDPLEAGKFRNTQVFVGEYVPPSPNEVQQLMDEFIEWLNSDEVTSIHPIEFAALAHYKLVFIHPFFDGNGRTARLLMNLILMQAGFPPVIVRVEDRHLYYKHLETANEGDIRPFIRFIARCTELTLDGFLMVSSDTSLSRQGIANNKYKKNHSRTIIVEQESTQTP